MWPWLASANLSPEDSPGKAERHIPGPFPHSSGAVAVGPLRNSSGHPGFCLHAGTNHSAIQVWVKAKALSACVCAAVRAHSSIDICCSVFAASPLPKANSFSTLAFGIISPEHQSILPLHGSGAFGDLPVACRKKPNFPNIEIKISFTPVIWPQTSLLNTEMTTLYLRQIQQAPAWYVPALQLPTSGPFFLMFPQTRVPSLPLPFSSNSTHFQGSAQMLLPPEAFSWPSQLKISISPSFEHPYIS